jgi:putative ABC transport system substrate-binding protein
MGLCRQLACVVATLALLAPCATAFAQRADRVYRIGFLSAFRLPEADRDAQGCPVKGNANWRAFVEGLRERGYEPGRNLVVTCRTTAGKDDLAEALAEELVRLSPDLLVAVSSPNARAAKQATSAIPIVFLGVVNPVGRGVVASLARPGGNVTGLSDDAGTQSVGKLFELAKELVPGAKRVDVLAFELPDREVVFKRDIDAAAAALGISIAQHMVREPKDIDAAFESMVRGGARVLVVIPTPFMALHGPRIVELATRAKLPGVYPFAEHARAGGPVAYDIDRVAAWRRVGDYADRIFRGAKAGDLPVEQPAEFRLIVNPGAARELGIAIPPSLQLRASDVIAGD